MRVEKKGSHDILISKSTFVKQNLEQFQAKYKVGPQVGSGSFGTVRRCVHLKTGQTRAVKLIEKARGEAPSEKETLKKELEILRSLDHPNIVKLYEYFEDARRYYIVTE